ncbi:MAG: hypothetical protein MUF51_05255, partial [Vicinamibacteria bacterium]|nr:hypothetical protein [Vicinamibacteria bacterium]
MFSAKYIPWMAGLVTTLTIFMLLVPFVTLFDYDSYFHLAVSHRYLERGFHGGLEWARMSAMHANFGDKEFLFHVLIER